MVSVGGREVSAGKILIAVGARPQVPDCPGNELGITSNDAFHLEKLPKRIVIAGGGSIANEFAGFFNEFGADVTIVNRSAIGRESVRERGGQYGQIWVGGV